MDELDKRSLAKIILIVFAILAVLSYIIAAMMRPSHDDLVLRELDVIQAEIELAKDNKDTESVFIYHINNTKEHIRRAKKYIKP